GQWTAVDAVDLLGRCGVRDRVPARLGRGWSGQPDRAGAGTQRRLHPYPRQGAGPARGADRTWVRAAAGARRVRRRGTGQPAGTAGGPGRRWVPFRAPRPGVRFALEPFPVSALSVAEPVTATRESAPAHPGPNRRADLLMLAVCVAGGLYLTWQMWVDPNHRA